MKKLLLAAILLAGTSVFGQVSVGIRIGAPPAPRVLRVRPNNPGPGYSWLDGYWYPSNNRYVWHAGYYTRPPYEGAAWVSPRYEGQQFYAGYWSGNDRRYDHDHRWDRDKRNRDYNRNDNGNGNGKGR
jgi:hypothetical protein